MQGMKTVKVLLKKSIQPSLYITAMMCLISVALLLYSVFLLGIETAVGGFIVLCLGILCFAYSTYAVVINILKYIKTFNAWAQKNPITKKFAEDYDFRTVCFSVASIVINLGYAVFNGVYGFIYGTLWYISLFLYYLMLIIMRGSISARAVQVDREFDDDKRELGQMGTYRMAGIMMLIFTIALNFMLWVLLSQQDYGFRKPVLIILVSGIYALVKIIMAIVNMILTRKRNDRITHAIRNINMADALVSVLTLLMAVLSRFTDAATATRTVRVLGTIICVYVAVVSLYMVISSFRRIRNKKRSIFGNFLQGLEDDFEQSLDEPYWNSMNAAGGDIGPVEYLMETPVYLEAIDAISAIDAIDASGEHGMGRSPGVTESTEEPYESLVPNPETDLGSLFIVTRGDTVANTDHSGETDESEAEEEYTLWGDESLDLPPADAAAQVVAQSTYSKKADGTDADILADADAAAEDLAAAADMISDADAETLAKTLEADMLEDSLEDAAKDAALPDEADEEDEGWDDPLDPEFMELWAELTASDTENSATGDDTDILADAAMEDGGTDEWTDDTADAVTDSDTDVDTDDNTDDNTDTDADTDTDSLTDIFAELEDLVDLDNMDLTDIKLYEQEDELDFAEQEDNPDFTEQEDNPDFTEQEDNPDYTEQEDPDTADSDAEASDTDDMLSTDMNASANGLETAIFADECVPEAPNGTPEGAENCLNTEQDIVQGVSDTEPVKTAISVDELNLTANAADAGAESAAGQTAEQDAEMETCPDMPLEKPVKEQGEPANGLYEPANGLYEPASGLDEPADGLEEPGESQE